MAKHVLLVDDEAADQQLIRSAFARIGSDAVVGVAEDIESAKAALRGPQMPVITIVDLRLSGESGLDLVTWMRGRPETRTVPVVMLSGSADHTDIRSCYDAGANAYLTKPSTLDEVDDLVRRIDAFWLGAVALADDPR